MDHRRVVLAPYTVRALQFKTALGRIALITNTILLYRNDDDIDVSYEHKMYNVE